MSNRLWIKRIREDEELYESFVEDVRAAIAIEQAKLNSEDDEKKIFRAQGGKQALDNFLASCTIAEKEARAYQEYKRLEKGES